MYEKYRSKITNLIRDLETARLLFARARELVTNVYLAFIIRSHAMKCMNLLKRLKFYMDWWRRNSE